jgi:DNA-binding transcriptional regulator YhcF (GntR family)
MEEVRPHHKMGFAANLNQAEIVKALYGNGEIKEGDKVVSKTKIIDVKNRTQDRAYKEVVKKLSDSGVVEFKRGYGYYARAGYETALKAINRGV